MKKSQLATPKGIDHDYNYLTSIERQIDSAERDAKYRGFIIDNGNTDHGNWRAKGLDGPKKGEEPLRRATERCGVIIERAPEGMSRRKQNVTRWQKRSALRPEMSEIHANWCRKKEIQWTVEWIRPHSPPELGSCLESTPMVNAYHAHFNPPPAERDHDGPPRKRAKQIHEDIEDGKLNTCHDSQPLERPLAMDGAALEQPVEEDALCGTARNDSLNERSRFATDSGPTSVEPENFAEQKVQSLKNSVQPITATPSPPHLTESLAQIVNGSAPEAIDTENLVPPLHYYLHAPRLPSSCPVLIPLAPDSTLSEALHSRLVLEFPTIYVLQEPPETLSQEYITEESFFKKIQEDGYREQLEAKLTGQEEGEVGEGLAPSTDNVDEGKLEAVLKKDLTTLKGATG